MTQIASVDWEAKRFFLHADTVTAGFDAWEAVREVKILQQANANNEQNYELFLSREGKVPKDNADPNLATVFTPRFVSFRPGWRGVPVDSTHRLDLIVEMLSDDGVSDRDVFDRSSVAANVDIDAVYDQVELLLVQSGSGLDAVQDAMLTNIEAILSNVEGGLDADAILRIILAATAGKGGDDGSGTYRYRDIADTKDRVVASVTGSERTSVTLDPS